MKRSCEIGLASVNGSSRRAGFGCSRERLRSLKSACSRTIQNASANRFVRGAHHRRCAREGLTVSHYGLLRGKSQGEMADLTPIADYAELFSDLTSTASNQARTDDDRSEEANADRVLARAPPIGAESPRPSPPARRAPMRIPSAAD